MKGTVKDIHLVRSERGRKRVVVFVEVHDVERGAVQTTFVLTVGNEIDFWEMEMKDYFQIVEIHDVREGK